MVRPLRLEFPDTLYHLTAWDNAQQDIYVDDPDRQRFLEVLAREILCVKRIDMYYWPSENERVMSGKVAILPPETGSKTSVRDTTTMTM